jgi:hypothetical protein
MSWHEIRVDGIARIDRIVAVFEIWAPETLPFAKFKVKIVERSGNRFAGCANVAIRKPKTGEPEFVAGLGGSVEEALKDTLHYFFREIEENSPGRPLDESDFAWSAFEDF